MYNLEHVFTPVNCLLHKTCQMTQNKSKSTSLALAITNINVKFYFLNKLTNVL